MSKVNLSTVYQDNYPILTQLIVETPTAKLTVDLDEEQIESLRNQFNSVWSTKRCLQIRRSIESARTNLGAA